MADGMRFSVDLREGMAVGGFLKGISERIGTPQYIGPILKFVHERLSEAFDAHMEVISPTRSNEFHHVYEWGEIGDKDAQLWENVLHGHGNARVATFEWKPSHTVVPVEHPDAVGHVSEHHIFTWKAPVMEYSTNITIAPKNSDVLVYFTGPPGPNTPEELHFSRDPITVANPGGPDVKGAFTREYVSWWAGSGAADLFRQELSALLETQLGDMPLNTVAGEFRTGTRRRTKTISLFTLADAEAAEAAGRRAAYAWLENRRRYFGGLNGE